MGDGCRRRTAIFHDEMLEQFSECWEGLDDPRSGNASLHDFHELLLIALCSRAARARSIWPCLRSRKSLFCMAFSSWRTDHRATTPSAGCFATSTQSSFGPVHGEVLGRLSGRGRHRRQGAAPLLRPSPWQGGAEHGQRVGLAKPPPRRPSTCSARPSRRSAGTPSSARTGRSRTVCTGGSMSL